MPERSPEAEASVSVVVGESDLASRLGEMSGERFPAVLATSRMIALMELASAKAMKAVLADGELSVGTAIDVTHTAPTPPGATVRTTARYRGREGKLFVFEVVAHDEAGEIGRGVHKRAVVSTERLLEGARRRLPQAAEGTPRS